MVPARAASAGIAFFTTSEAATSAWVMAAPMVTPSPAAAMPRSSGNRPMSIRSVGAARRCFIVGISVWPPEM